MLVNMPQFLGNNVKFLESKCLVRAFCLVGDEGKAATAVNAKTNSTTLATTPQFLGSKGLANHYIFLMGEVGRAAGLQCCL